MNSVSFLINTLFDLYIMVILLRIWLQVSRADFYNPFSQFIVKATQPIVAPLRRLIPSIGGIDSASVVLVSAVIALKILSLQAIGTLSFELVILPVLIILGIIKQAGLLLFWVLIIRAIMSWVSQGANPIQFLFMQLTEPLLKPIRQILPSMGGLDLSVLVAFFALQFANKLMQDWLGVLWVIS